MWTDALLAYLHYTAIFLLFAFLTVQLILVRGPLDERVVRLLGRMDIWYFSSAIAALATGFLRATLGAKGADFYFNAWPIYAKLALFIAVGVISVKPTLTFIHWRRAFEKDPAWRVPAGEQARIRRLMMVEVHLAALIPVFAVIMSRGLGH
jgi:putative membrane protein